MSTTGVAGPIENYVVVGDHLYVGTMLRTKVPLSVLSNSQQLNGRSTTSIPVLPVLGCAAAAVGWCHHT